MLEALRDWASIGIAAGALVVSAMAYRRVGREGRTVGWSFVVDVPGARTQYYLVRTGGGIAHDVEITTSKGATILSRGEREFAKVERDRRLWVGDGVPPSSHITPGTVTVTWAAKPGGKRREDWTHDLR